MTFDGFDDNDGFSHPFPNRSKVCSPIDFVMIEILACLPRTGDRGAESCLRIPRAFPTMPEKSMERDTSVASKKVKKRAKIPSKLFVVSRTARQLV